MTETPFNDELLCQCCSGTTRNQAVAVKKKRLFIDYAADALLIWLERHTAGQSM